MNRTIKIAIAAKLMVGIFAAWSYADETCGQALPLTMIPHYDQSGRLEHVEDAATSAELRFFWSGPLVSVSETEFKLELSKPDKWGRTQIFGPRRSTDYNSKSGALSAIHTHENVRVVENKKAKADPNKPGRADFVGTQTSFYNLEGIDFSKFKQKDGSIKYTGPAVSETISYDSKPLGDRTVDVTEPLNIKTAKCYPFQGYQIPISRPTKTAAVDEAQSQPKTAPAKKAPADKQPPLKKGERRICVEGGCITIHDDEQESSDDTELQSVE